MSDNVKVLFIHHGAGIGGAPISLLNLILKLDKEKYLIKVAFINGGVATDLFKSKGIKTEVVDAPNIYFSHDEAGKIGIRYFYRYSFILYYWLKTAYIKAPRYLKKQDAEIIHLNSHVLSSWAYAAKRLGFKVVCHNRETIAEGNFGFRRKLLRKLLDYSSDRIINISLANENRIGLKHKSTVIYNFIPIPKTYRQPFDSESSVVKVLYLGGMAKIKGFETVVSCMRYLAPGIKIQFAGGTSRLHSDQGIKGFMKNILKKTLFRGKYKLLEKIHRAPNAELLGFLTEPLKFIDACDILITPFKVDHFSRPAMEAFAYGKPVIGSNIEGMAEIIDHEVNGLLVERDNPKALAEAINELCKNPECAIQMGKKGREKAQKEFSPNTNTRKMEKIYEELKMKSDRKIQNIYHRG